ncbi:protein-glutamate O-methyltransferase CheR [Paraglaciecola aquimarina]|uniref:protein-glutamate O-methyltransferase n=1 Tax=Paraglaciecola algarum TaxID=3050085 RepID=A0ABS9D8M9_9ALTE|nr:protein-glutamate O-methyltransferase CheR [Paraglaciecola sp. G1-23]MCF2948159.1 protein-glutamate O-methyltransferase CheR [Paraglaciecola sp. G1-23]
MDEIGLRQYQLFCQFIEQACGIVLGENKQYLVRSRLSPLVKSTEGATFNSFIDSVVQGDQKARLASIEVMTTNETLWFRDSYPFKLLEKEIFPKLVQQSNSNMPIKVWSAACSSGQEAYSIGMTWLSFKKNNNISKRLEIVGTDISTEMLQHCQKAEYDQLSISRGLPSQFQKDYFEQIENNKLRVKPELKGLASFKPFNLLANYGPLGQFNIVFCRNVLIYFSPQVKKQILQKIAACLQEGGILFLGASESISDLSDEFTMIRGSLGLYYQKKPH